MPAIAVAFLLVAGLLLWFVIGSRGPWPLKLVAIVAASAFTFLLWDALDSFSGWPAEAQPPERALLLASSVDEPDAVYLWLVPPVRPGPLEYRPDDAEPRAYKLPYSRELHEQVDLAARMAQSGSRVEVRMDDPDATGRRAGSRRPLRVYRLPLATAPRKHED